MEEIARQFREELQELLDRYKNSLTTLQIMRIAQPIFTKTIGIKDNPGRFIIHPTVTGKWSSECHTLQEVNGIKVPTELLEEPDPEFKKMLQGELEPGDEPKAFSGPNPICSQGPDGTCAIYKSGWNSCKGCSMYHGDTI